MMRELGQLGSDTEGERLRIFRDYLASTICLASPLLLDACKPDELDEAFWRLRPNPCWPKRSRVQTRINGRQCESRHGQKMGFKAIEMDTNQQFGAIEQLVLRVSPPSAHMVLKIGSLVLRTQDRGGSLSIPRHLTSAESEALFYAELDAVFGHPICDGRYYPIVGVKRAIRQPRSLIEFAAAPQEWRVPWARPWDIPF